MGNIWFKCHVNHFTSFMHYRLTIDRGSEKSLIQILSRIKLKPHFWDLLLVFTTFWIWLLNLRCQKCNVYIAWLVRLSCEVKIRFYKSIYLLHEHCEVGFFCLFHYVGLHNIYVCIHYIRTYTYFKGVPQYQWGYHDGLIKLKISWVNLGQVTCEMLKKKPHLPLACSIF